MLPWQGHGGFSVHAQTRVEEWARPGLERLVRYCARPTFSLQQLHRLDDETLIYKLPKPDHRGRRPGPGTGRQVGMPIHPR